MPRGPQCILLALFGLLAACGTRPEMNNTGPYGLSQDDVREIKLLVSQRPDIRKPVSRILCDYTDHAVVTAGRRGYAGEVFNIFDVAKRHGRWMIDSPIREEHINVPSR
jgi:hypothetical protein